MGMKWNHECVRGFPASDFANPPYYFFPLPFIPVEHGTCSLVLLSSAVY